MIQQLLGKIGMECDGDECRWGGRSREDVVPERNVAVSAGPARQARLCGGLERGQHQAGLLCGRGVPYQAAEGTGERTGTKMGLDD